MTPETYAALVEQVAAERLASKWIPRATYRVQFNKNFTFRDAETLVPYLDALGISDLYASPIFKASPGSLHGYDVCDPSQLNPELGTEDDFNRLCAALKARGMGLLVDIVPNHMGIGSDCNTWWLDVLENGMKSPYADFFDIDWTPGMRELHGKVLLPVLEDQYGNVLESGKLALGFAEGAFHLAYGERHLPLAPGTYRTILEKVHSRMVTSLSGENASVQELNGVSDLLDTVEGAALAKPRLAALHAASSAFQAALAAVLAELNGSVGDPHSFDLLDDLLDAQHYRLAFWRVAGEEVNYRRFFDVNTMAALRTELPQVFEASHALIFRLLGEGKVTGLRIDHPDGLWNPALYFRELHERVVEDGVLASLDAPLSAPDLAILRQSVKDWFDRQLEANTRFPGVLYVVAEKILSEMEPLPLEWAVDGTTGYDFMNLVNSLFVDNRYEAELSRAFSDFTGRVTTFSQLEYSSKQRTMQLALAGEINLLARRLTRLSEGNRHTRDFTFSGLRHALREVIACLPIYRTYITEAEQVSERDQHYVEEAVRDAKRRNPQIDVTIFDFVRDTLLLRNLAAFDEQYRRRLVDFVMRAQQITPPVMAKSVEDTLFYIYNRLVSVNEVGGNPSSFGISPEEFAEENTKRCRLWPAAMLATSTHDTKRSEDVRARLNVLSELPGEWAAALREWGRLNVDHKQMLDTGPAPSANDEYLLYQTLLGTYEPEALESYADRIAAYMAKATKEAKVNTSWTNPNEAYDRAVDQFVRAILDSEEFIAAFLPLQQRVAYFGCFNSLAQTLLKLTCPGIPDIYRGTEVWDFSLVDPDNRRPVDYDRIRSALDRLEQGDRSALVHDLLFNLQDGRIKLLVIETALDLRRRYPDLFMSAPYLSLEASSEHVCAFMRVYEGTGVLVAVPRLVAGLAGGEQQSPLGSIWGDASLSIPDEFVGQVCQNQFTDETIVLEKETSLAKLLEDFPLGFFQFDRTGV